MEQLYMIEIFIDRVSVVIRDDEPEADPNVNLIIKVKFGPKTEFIVKEGQLAKTSRKDDIVECDEDGFRKWTRVIRVGKSYLFPAYPDTLLLTLSKFPLEIELWDDDEVHQPEMIGFGSMQWSTEFFVYIRETTDLCKLHEPLSLKQRQRIWAECCCRQVGDVQFILRVSALGESISTEFQQLLDSSTDSFVLRTNKAPSMFECKRVEGDDPNFCMVGSLYETATLEDPSLGVVHKTIEVCTELQSCGVVEGDGTCKHPPSGKPDEKKEPTIEKIKMGDIVGPCGNVNCPLAHKIRAYIRKLDVYKKETKGMTLSTKTKGTKKVCGQCGCKDDQWHRENCPEKDAKDGKGGKDGKDGKGGKGQHPICTACGGVAQKGETCEERIKKMYGTGLTPKGSEVGAPKLPQTGAPKQPAAQGAPPPPPPPQSGSPKKEGSPTGPKTETHYMIGIERDPEFMKSMFGKDYIVNNCQLPQITGNPPPPGRIQQPCNCQSAKSAMPKRPEDDIADFLAKVPPIASGRYMMPQTSTSVYNAEVKRGDDKKNAGTFCTDIPDDKDCKCAPPKPTPPCKTFDCECLTRAAEIDSRKQHKSYCPNYKHKPMCPVTMMHDEEEQNEFEEEPTVEPLPYGLPPIQLGPCPVLGRPCSVPDGFARMYKTAVTPAQPPSYSDGGKVCCSKEYERIKKALKEYMQANVKDHDYRCVNRYNIDTERRCCDREQRLIELMGKSCCGTHKLSIIDKVKAKLAAKDELRSKYL